MHYLPRRDGLAYHRYNMQHLLHARWVGSANNSLGTRADTLPHIACDPLPPPLSPRPPPGSTFTHWIADHNTLWRSPVTPLAVTTALEYYSLLGRAPGALYWAWMGVAAVCGGGSGWRVLRGMSGMGGSGAGGGFLFDGGSLGEWGGAGVAERGDAQDG